MYVYLYINNKYAQYTNIYYIQKTLILDVIKPWLIIAQHILA